jgi:iron complex transport system ATP-binding protein
LRDIDWRIAPDENWILFGRNGSGKTRLLEIIAGYRFPSSGAISRFGELAGHCDIRELRKRIGYVSTILREKFSPGENILDVVVSGLYASVGLYQEVEPEHYEFARELLASSGLSGREEDAFGILSDGERQKVIMLRAIISRPDLLILDEPTKCLDLVAREEFLATLEGMNSLHRASIIYVTHHVEEIIPLFSRILMLKSGAIYFSGTVKEGISSERLTELFQRRSM